VHAGGDDRSPLAGLSGYSLDALPDAQPTVEGTTSQQDSS